MDKVRVIGTIPTTYNCLYGVACLGEAEAWVNAEKNRYTNRQTRFCEVHSHQ